MKITENYKKTIDSRVPKIEIDPLVRMDLKSICNKTLCWRRNRILGTWRRLPPFDVAGQVFVSSGLAVRFQFIVGV